MFLSRDNDIVKLPMDYLILIAHSLHIHEAFLKHLCYMLDLETKFDVWKSSFVCKEFYFSN